MLKINENIARLKPSATLAINEKVKEMRSQGKEVFHFGFGQSPFPIPDLVVEELRKQARNSQYLPSLGLPELRMQIAEYLREQHSLDVEWEQVLIGPGSKELLFQTLLLLKGITLIPMGSWVSYMPQVVAKGGKFVIIPTQKKNAYKLSPDELEQICKQYPEEQKTLILNSPNNPTGAVYNEEELAALSKICAAHQVVVLSDEIYGRLNFSGQNSPSMAKYYRENTMVFGGLSKIFSGGGYRLGFLALPKAHIGLVPIYQAIFSETFSAVATPVQYAAVKAFHFTDQLREEIEKNTLILKSTATYVQKALEQFDVSCTPPQGGFYTVIDLEQYKSALYKKNLNTSIAMAEYILDECAVALLPGSDFYFPSDKPVFRLAYVDFDGTEWSKIPAQAISSEASHIREHAPSVFHGIESLKSLLQSL